MNRFVSREYVLKAYQGSKKEKGTLVSSCVGAGVPVLAKMEDDHENRNGVVSSRLVIELRDDRRYAFRRP